MAMTRKETQDILMAIQAAYPNYKVPDKTIAVNTWNAMLSDFSYEQVSAALKIYITTNTSGFAPGIGQIVENIYKITNPEELSEMEAWALVSRALRNGYYGAEKEFEKLPPIVRKAVGAPSQLRIWSQVDSDSIESVVQSNFMRTYRAVVSREREMKKIPQGIKDLIEATMKRGGGQIWDSAGSRGADWNAN